MPETHFIQEENCKKVSPHFMILYMIKVTQKAHSSESIIFLFRVGIMCCAGMQNSEVPNSGSIEVWDEFTV